MFWVKMSWKNLFRNKRRSLITIGVIAMGTCATLLFNGFVENSYWGLQERFTRTGNGHIQIADPQWFFSARPEDHRVSAGVLGELASIIQKDPELSQMISGVSLRRNISGLISSGEQSTVFVGTGVEPEAHLKLSPWVEFASGRPLLPHLTNEVVVGATLAEKIGAKPGDTLSLLLSTDDGRTNAMDVTLAGTTLSVSRAEDSVSLLIPFSTSLELLRSEKADALFVGLKNTELTDPALSRINQILSEMEEAPLKAMPWYEVAEFYRGVHRLYEKIFTFVKVVLFAVILLAVMNTLYMVVSERRQEVGMLRAVGFRPATVQTQFILEGLFMALIGLALGVLVASAIAFGVLLLGGIPMPPPPGSTKGYPLFFTITSAGVWEISWIVLVASVAAVYVPGRQSSRGNISGALSSRLACLAFLFFTVAGFSADVTPAEMLKRVDSLRRVPIEGFSITSKFENLNSKTAVTYRVYGTKEHVIATAISDAKGDRMSILSADGGMWMQTPKLSKPMRIAPAQRLLGQTSNADVVNVRYQEDYTASALEPAPGGSFLLTLLPKGDKAAYGKIELLLVDASGKIASGSFYALSGKKIKDAKYEYTKEGSALRLSQISISDAVNASQKTQITIGKAVSLNFPSGFFNPNNLLRSANAKLTGLSE